MPIHCADRPGDYYAVRIVEVIARRSKTNPPQVREAVHHRLSGAASLAKSQLAGTEIPHALRGLHTQIPLTEMINHCKRRNFGVCSWHLLAVADDLVIGDTAPLWDGAPELVGLYGTRSPPKAVLLPVDPGHVLVARSRGIKDLPGCATLNEATIDLSTDFAVGTKPAGWFAERQSALGCRKLEEHPEAMLGIDPRSAAEGFDGLSKRLGEWAEQVFSHRWATNGPPLHAEIPVDPG